MNVANRITLFRIFLVPLIVFFLLYSTKYYMHLIAAFIFLVASLTDLIDGYIARYRNEVTNLGKLLDPIADKLLTSSALISLVDLQKIPAWIVVFLIGRDFCISGLRNIAASQGIVIQASAIAKYKTVFEICGILLLILSGTSSEELFYYLKVSGWAVIFLAASCAVISGVQYFSSFWDSIDLTSGN
ncbi:MAG: CDP-diacylglycerol--glycerol-3-phosphate 3-phosphatidyltransferase [Candidatus Schekmanbacteria bacterium]|nr:MAG: CDP-diacylglycerol--glycerol-3-phosphate 3-phosphatidyltransferase [Candidatus Schekmanbacteria bacterium]